MVTIIIIMSLYIQLFGRSLSLIMSSTCYMHVLNSLAFLWLKHIGSYDTQVLRYFLYHSAATLYVQWNVQRMCVMHTFVPLLLSVATSSAQTHTCLLSYVFPTSRHTHVFFHMYFLPVDRMQQETVCLHSIINSLWKGSGKSFKKQCLTSSTYWEHFWRRFRKRFRYRRSNQSSFSTLCYYCHGMTHILSLTGACYISDYLWSITCVYSYCMCKSYIIILFSKYYSLSKVIWYQFQIRETTSFLKTGFLNYYHSITYLSSFQQGYF